MRRLTLCGTGRIGHALMLTLSVAGLIACERAVPHATTAGAPASADSADSFLEQHWARPLPAQGELPGHLKTLGISLAPGSCASCHPAQFQDWNSSLHSRAMGPGILGQLLDMPVHARNEHQNCLRCHAPLAEQADSLVAALKKNRLPLSQEKSLHEQGLVCAACHVRAFAWYGPARRDGSSMQGSADSTAPHGGWIANRAFESSKFCAACHQFRDGEFALNGKLLENTYREWEQSRYARTGQSCQTCHMPERRHLWRGIHDPEMVKKGITIRLGALSSSGNRLAARLSLTNSGVGHYFPTYVTPKVVLRAYQEDRSGRRIDVSVQEYVIGRQVELDLSKEIADTRLAPDARASLDYQAARQPGAAGLRFDVEVQPDAFYLEFYLALLLDPENAKGKRQILQARDQARASPYLLFSQTLPLPE